MENDYKCHLHLDDSKAATVSKLKHLFKALWLEDRKIEAIQIMNPTSEHLLLCKYGGRMWQDPCKTQVKYFLTGRESMRWMVFVEQRQFACVICIKIV